MRFGSIFVLVVGLCGVAAHGTTLTPSRAVGRTHDCAAYYPLDSRLVGETGQVEVGYDVETDGSISNVHVVRGSGLSRLDVAAITCVTKGFQNTAAMIDNVPVASPGHVVAIEFSLNGEPGLADWSERIAAGIDYADFGQYQLAIQDFDQALTMNSGLAVAYYLRGRAEYQLAQFQAAVGDLNRAIALVCSAPEARSYLHLAEAGLSARLVDAGSSGQPGTDLREVTYSPNENFSNAVTSRLPEGWQCTRQDQRMFITAPPLAPGMQPQAVVIMTGGKGNYSTRMVPLLALGSQNEPPPDKDVETTISGLKAHILSWRIENIIGESGAPFKIEVPVISATPLLYSSGEFKCVLLNFADARFALLLFVLPTDTSSRQIEEANSLLDALTVIQIPSVSSASRN